MESLDKELINTIKNGEFMKESESIIDRVSILLLEGADPNIANDYGNTPLFLAIQNRYPTIVRLLLEKGSNPNIRANYLGHTLLITASAIGNIEIVESLLRYGANPYKRTSDGFSALTTSIVNNNHDVAELLKYYMRIYRIQALKRGNLTRRKLHTSMARKRSTTSQLGEEYGLGEDIIQMLNSRMTRPTQVDMIDEIPRNMRETLDREPESGEINWEEIFREHPELRPEQSGSGKRKTKKRKRKRKY